MYQHGTLVNGTKDYHLRNPSSLILRHTQFLTGHGQAYLFALFGLMALGPQAWQAWQACNLGHREVGGPACVLIRGTDQSHVAEGQSQWYHFDVGEFTTHVRTYFSGWIGMFTGGTIWILTHGHVRSL